MAVRHILLTGRPGIGKTSLIKNIHESLSASGLEVQGFFTEEIRHGRERSGFDVVTLDGDRGSLARVQQSASTNFQGKKSYFVGKYEVQLTSFENTALPTLRLPKNVKEGRRLVFIIDEIGKMELFSQTFVSMVRDILRHPHTTVIATIPIPKGKPLPFVEEVRTHQNAKVFTITMENRNNILEEILQTIKCATS